MTGIIRMTDKLLLRMSAPLVLLGALLLAVGIGSAWYIERLQQRAFDVLAWNVSSMRAAEELEIGLREVRSRLDLFLETGERSHLDALPALRVETDRCLAEAVRTGTTPQEEELMRRVQAGYQHLFTELDRVARETPAGDESRKTVRRRIDDVLADEILVPVHDYLALNEALAARSAADNRAAANWMVCGLLLLGTCGPAAGALAGAALTRRLNRSLVRLSLPIRDAAGKLNQVVGPIALAPGWGLEELEAVLHRMAGEIGAVLERLQESQRQALRAEQLAAVGQLAAGLAHELRNPLMAMKILVQSAAERGEPPALSGRGLLVLEEEIGRLEQLTRTFLEFARPPQLAKRPCEAGAAIEDAVQLVSGKALRRGARIACRLPDRPVVLPADLGQLRQVLLNLLLNALEAVPNGGTVVVALEGRAEPAGRAGTALIRVTDTGPGLPAELGADIFRPFVSTKPTGIGLGLSICQRIVEAHGGKISATSRPEGGAEFLVRLPCP